MLGAVSFEAKGSDTGPREKARKFNVVWLNTEFLPGYVKEHVSCGYTRQHVSGRLVWQ